MFQQPTDVTSRISKNIEDAEKIALDFLVHLKSKSESPQRKNACIVCLSGDLGSGKTTFTKAIAKVLGISETVTSPTFVIEKIYTVKSPQYAHIFSYLIHIDAYRLEKGEELLRLGWDRIISDPKNLILIEWPEKVAGIIPDNAEAFLLKV